MANYFSKGKILIPYITGNIVVTASAIPSVQETVPVTWLTGKKAAYTVGHKFTLSDDSNYIATEEIPVAYGKTYSFDWDCPSASAAFYYVGVDVNNYITEVEKFSPGKGGLVACEWTPTVTTTVGLRLRSYSDANITGVAEMKVS